MAGLASALPSEKGVTGAPHLPRLGLTRGIQTLAQKSSRTVEYTLSHALFLIVGFSKHLLCWH